MGYNFRFSLTADSPSASGCSVPRAEVNKIAVGYLNIANTLPFHTPPLAPIAVTVKINYDVNLQNDDNQMKQRIQPIMLGL